MSECESCGKVIMREMSWELENSDKDKRYDNHSKEYR